MKDLLKSNKVIVKSFDKIKENYYKHLFSDEYLIKKKFKNKLNRELNLNEPVYYNDKLQWLKLYWRNTLAQDLADKYKVRNYVSEQIGAKYLNQLYDVYNSVEEINISELPKSFVLKCNHGSGYNIVVQDKDQHNWKQEFVKLDRWMNQNYYWRNREWVYKNIKPMITCEKFLTDKDGNPPKDYKLFCFNGEPKLIEVDHDRFTDIKRNFYDINWNFIDLKIKYPNDPSMIEKSPKNLDEMLELSRKLSCDFPHVRVDFYNIDGTIVFGEMTFFHESGMGEISPIEFEKTMGDYINLKSVR